MTSAHPTLRNPVRIVTAASLFDGHDASINIIRRMLQDFGAEVIHLGHNRSVMDVVTTALQEGAQGANLREAQTAKCDAPRVGGGPDVLSERARSACGDKIEGNRTDVSHCGSHVEREARDVADAGRRGPPKA